jgi:anti-sigma B factor antagonist
VTYASTGPGPHLDVQLRYLPDTTQVALSGELDVATTHHVADCIDSLLESGRPRVELDLSGLTFCDNSGVTALLRARARLQSQGGSLTITAAQPSMMRLMIMTGTLRALVRDVEPENCVSA